MALCQVSTGHSPLSRLAWGPSMLMGGTLGTLLSRFACSSFFPPPSALLASPAQPPIPPAAPLVRRKFLETSRNMPLAAPCSALGPGAGAASPRVAHTRARTHGGPGGRPALSGRALSGRALSGRALSGRARIFLLPRGQVRRGGATQFVAKAKPTDKESTPPAPTVVRQ